MARNKTVTKIEFPATIEDEIAVLDVEIRNFHSLIKETTDSVNVALHKQFINLGGCTQCRGRGWVVTWDTMDSMTGCYAEYASCSEPGCTEATRKHSGLDLSHENMYDKNRGENISGNREKTAIYQTLIAPLHLLRVDLEGRRAALMNEAQIFNGDTVVVKKGRTAFGSTLVVAYMFATEYGHKLLLKDPAVAHDRSFGGEWVYKKNVEKIRKS